MPLPLGIPEKGKPIGLYGEPYSTLLSMGNERLDIVLNGGIPAKNNVLFIAPSSKERDIFLTQFIEAGIEDGDLGVYITTDKDPEYILKLSDKFKWRLREAYKKNELKFIDCYSWTLGKEVNEVKDYGIIYVPGPNALNDISISLSKIMEEIASPGKNIRIVFNSVSTLLLYNNNDIVFKFLQITGARLKSLNSTTMFTIEDKMHDEKILSTLQHLTDALLRLEKKKEWYISSSWSGSLITTPVEFTHTGVIVP